jgi:type IV pilus assembly protein PilB
MARRQYTDKISDILLKHKVIDPQVLEDAQKEAQEKGTRLEKHLVEKKLVKSVDMTLALAEYLDMKPISLAHFVPSRALADLIPKEFLTKRLIVPIAHVGKNLTVATGDPFDLMAIDELKTITGMDVTALAAPEHEVQEATARIFADSAQGMDMEALLKEADSDVLVVEEQAEEQNLDEMLQETNAAPVIRMVNMILVEALRTGASDIHIEPMEKKVRLRNRVDGELLELPGPPKSLQAAVISRIKILADLDIAERRLPQDGRFNIKALGKEVDLRVSVLPTVHGEKVVMRILDKASLAPSLKSLGLDKRAEESMEYGINQPHGIILVTGPTGSGKTTTLYSCLQDMNKTNVNIVTVEDPVEYQLEGINQVQMHAEIGLTFATALRSILRQDPDIVLVGEIRDGETAEIAVKAALTGHLVLSTLHTNDAPSAVTRLIDMGIEPFMLGSCLVLAQAQRLYRKLCQACKKPAQLDPDVLRVNHIDPAFFEGARVFRAAGCPRCTNGYKGRGAVMEVLLVNDELREGILRGANTTELGTMACRNGMVTLKEAGLSRVKDGITSIEAALEVTGG